VSEGVSEVVSEVVNEVVNECVSENVLDVGVVIHHYPPSCHWQ
jgi:hypothetical protein